MLESAKDSCIKELNESNDMAKKEFNTAFNSFQVLEQKGQGGSGIVYKAIEKNNPDVNVTYAVKCLNPNEATSIKRKRFKHEIFFCMNNSHKNVVKVLDYGLTDIDGKTCPFYVMPYYPSTLRLLMRQVIDKEKTIDYFLQILEGVEFAHKMGVWHRDIKPENILYDPQTDILVIADFGIAHFQEEYLQTIIETDTKDRIGNYLYSAPEQRVNPKLANYKADIYSLGLILNEIFTGEILQGHGFTIIANKSPDFAFLDEIVEQMIQQSPEKRFDSINMIKQRINILSDISISQQRLSKLSNPVIQASEIEDILISNPIKIEKVDYKDGNLRFTLSHKINSDWENTFYKPGNFVLQAGIVEPKLVRFVGNEAILRVQSYMEPTQDMVNYVKGYIEQANVNYKRLCEEKQRANDEAERKKLREQVEEEQKRQKFLKSLKS